LLTAGSLAAGAQDAPAMLETSTNFPPASRPPADEPPGNVQRQNWNIHAQNTIIVQGYPGFHAQYSGPNSLPPGGQTRETVTLDLYSGVRLWRGAEAHVDGLMWQGYGIGETFGMEDFPNGDAYKAGTAPPNGTLAHLFIRQTIGFGGEQENVPDGQMTLAGEEDISRLTITIGRFSPLDIFDNNTYADDPHTQFMNWAMMGNVTWDYGQDTVGYTTGITLELNQPKWTLRYGFFQMPGQKNGFTGDDQYLMWPGRGAYGPFLKSWAMSTELERRWSIKAHPGAIRFLAWLNEADMATYSAAAAYLLANPGAASSAPPMTSGGDIPDSVRAYRFKYGFGLNSEQEIARGIGIFSRLGWNDGHEETWTFTDINYSASLGISVNGERWRRPDDTFGLAGILGGASRNNQRFLEAGGEDMLDGDGALNYGWEKVLETYYDFKIWQSIHGAVDYQFIVDPAFNRDRGPVSVFAARLHWEF
jgi:high affinity Mn2+ porin